MHQKNANYVRKHFLCQYRASANTNQTVMYYGITRFSFYLCCWYNITTASVLFDLRIPSSSVSFSHCSCTHLIDCQRHILVILCRMANIRIVSYILMFAYGCFLKRPIEWSFVYYRKSINIYITQATTNLICISFNMLSH
jgi:hypothetical protein